MRRIATLAAAFGVGPQAICAAALLGLARRYDAASAPWLAGSFQEGAADGTWPLAADPSFRELAARLAAELPTTAAPLRLLLPPLPYAASRITLAISAPPRPSLVLEAAAAAEEGAGTGNLARLASHFRVFLASAAAGPDLPLSALFLLPPEERQLLRECNDTGAALAPAGLCLHHLVAAQAARTPRAPAVVFAGVEITYGEFMARANRLARHLRELGVGPDVLVAICAERSFDLIVGIVAILQAGGAYVPFDPSYPAERLGFMLADSGAPVLLLQRRLAGTLAERPGTRRVWLDEPAAWSGESDLPPSDAALPDHLAYVIYTSGSTGQPKGAMNTHRAIVNRLLWIQREHGLAGDDAVLQKTPISFDVSVWEIFWPLATGARLVLARPGGHQDPGYLMEVIGRERVTVMQFVPTMLRAFLAEPGLEALTGLRRVIAGGEALPPDLAERFLARSRADLHNLYGPTEAAIEVTAWRCPRHETAARVPIGRPIANVRIHLLDRRGEPVPPGVPGELLIGGVALARGYLGRPDLTAERFVPDPTPDPTDPGEAGGRLYRTGDLAVRRADGAIEFLGRLDHQVKIRGVRIELGEVEAVLEGHPAVAAAAAVVDEPGRLVAYAVPDPRRAGPLAGWLRLRAAGELAGVALRELADGLVVAGAPDGLADGAPDRPDDGSRLALPRLDDGAVVVAAEAGDGLLVLRAARGATGVRLHAFEPSAARRALLRLNALAYGLDARIHAGALGEGREGAPRSLGELAAAEGLDRIDLLVLPAGADPLAVLDDLGAGRVQRIAVPEGGPPAARREAAARLREALAGRGYAVSIEEAAGAPALVLARRVRESGREPGEVKAETAAEPPIASPERLVQELREWLRARLPAAAVPAEIALLPALPLLPSGKVDRRGLPPPAPALPELAPAGTAPRSAIERELAGLWEDLLGARVSVESSFFDLGGHSLLAVQLASRLRERWRVELSLAEIFTHPTLGELAAELGRRLARFAGPSGEKDEAGPPAGPAALPLARAPRDGPLPLSFSQERIWFLQQLDPDLRAYQFQATLELAGRLDVAALARSLGEVVRRHEIFRTTFPTVGEGPVERIHPPDPTPGAPLPLVDLGDLPPARLAGAAAACLADVLARRFAVDALPLARWTLLRRGAEDHVLIHVEHHLVHDGWSFNRFLEELAALYAAFRAGRPSPLPAPGLQFADFAYWQRRWMRGEVAEAQIEFWRRTLAGRPATLDLPTDRPWPKRQSFRGRVVRRELPADLAEALRAAARRHGASLFMTMEAAFAALLCRWSGQEQVNVGSAVANRRWRETEAMIGMFVDTVVLANDLAGDPTVAELIGRVRRLCLDASAHQDVPFDLVVEAVRPSRDLARNPLYQVSFSFHDSPLGELAFPGLATRLTEAVSNGSAKFEMNVICIPRSEQRVGRAAAGERGITVLWEYATALFDEATVERMLGHLTNLLGEFAARPAARLSELDLLAAPERAELAAWSGAAADLGAPEPVHLRVLAAAAERPGAPAVSGAGAAWSYGDLARAAGRLARRLRRRGIGRGGRGGRSERVAVCMERSPSMVAAFLAVLASGAAYLPLDPAHPRERLAGTLADSGAAALLTDPALAVSLAAAARSAGIAAVEAVDAGLAEPGDGADDRADEGAADPPAAPDPDEVAYVIYTSGSTGAPKGAELTHRGLANLAAWHRRAYGVGAGDRATQLASPAFDAAVWEIWPCLTAGASLHQPADEVRADPGRLAAWLAAEGITLAFLPTPLAEAVLDLPELPAGLALRALLTGGDRLRRAPRQPLPFALVNHYGPTEATVVATCAAIEVAAAGADGAPPPIGRPIANVEAHVLDLYGQPAPAGVPGELAIGGAGLARGYLGRPSLTAERFVPHPRGAAGERLYRTGDRARRRPDGALDFLGRLDAQVKIRGFRIEPGEIEAALAAHPAVREAAVVACPGAGEPRLAAFYVARREVAERELRDALRRRLPEAMVPADLLPLTALPLGATGKVDRAALIALAGAGTETARASAPAAPQTAVEKLLAGLWSEVIGVGPLGPGDDFFALGGHSILATRMLSRLRDRLAVEVPLSALFEAPTLSEFAAVVEATLPAADGPA